MSKVGAEAAPVAWPGTQIDLFATAGVPVRVECLLTYCDFFNLGGGETEGRVNYEVNSKERETVIVRVKLEVMRSGSKSRSEVVKVNKRLIMGRMMNLAFGVRESKATYELPIEVKGADIRAEGDVEEKGGNVVITRHTLAGRFLQWCE